jgi:uncharacterized cupredoxin-like copper-binding protein
MKHHIHALVVGITLTMGLTATGCGGISLHYSDDGGHVVNDDSDDPDDNATSTKVDVALHEFTVTPSPKHAPAGPVKFHVANKGSEVHEFLVIRTDLAPDALPQEANGSYEEDGEGTELLDEIGEIMPGDSADLEIDLEEGAHVLICNMVEGEGDDVEAHYAMGMHSAFDVDAPDDD